MDARLYALVSISILGMSGVVFAADKAPGKAIQSESLRQQAFMVWCSRVARTSREQAVAAKITPTLVLAMERQSFEQCISIFKR